MKRYRGFLLAAAATAAVAAWQAATVNVNYNGNWTALFCTGSTQSLPPSVAPGTYVFRGSTGYDGQFYRLVARSPWGLEEVAPYLDAPAYRGKRILLPAAAWALGGGRGGVGTDAAYIIAVLLCVFGGVYAAARLLQREGLPDWGASLFVLLPGTLISIDRMTVDIALYSLLAFLLAFWGLLPGPVRWALLALCPLVRELGFLVIGAAALTAMLNRKVGPAVAAALSAAPAAAWYWWLDRSLAAVQNPYSTVLIPHSGYHLPTFGIVQKMFQPTAYDLVPWARFATQALDVIALLSLLLGMLISLAQLRRGWRSFPQLLVVSFVALFVLMNFPSFFLDPFAYPRAFTPLLGLVALEGWRRKTLWHALPLAGVSVRVVWQLSPQVKGILDAIAS
jgi:hypothetical protein